MSLNLKKCICDYKLWMVCWQNQSHCVAELLPGWASAWLKLPSKWSATAYNIFLPLSVSNIEVRLSILQSVICKSLSWAEKWIFYVLWYVDIHSYVASKNLWAMPKSIYSMCGFTCHMPNLTNANVTTRWTMKDKRKGKSWLIYSLCHERKHWCDNLSFANATLYINNA